MPGPPGGGIAPPEDPPRYIEPGTDFLIERLSGLLAHRRTGDVENDAILDGLIGGFAEGLARLGAVGYGLDGVPGTRVLQDPRVAPYWALAHAAQYVGATVPGRFYGETREEWADRIRAALVYPFGMKRGSYESIRRAVAPLLTGTKTIVIADDYGGPYDLLVRTITSETPDPEAVRLALEGDFYSGGRRGSIRAEMKLTYLVADSVTFAEATRQFDDVAADVTFADATAEDVT
jgi:hypothetical protein